MKAALEGRLAAAGLGNLERHVTLSEEAGGAPAALCATGRGLYLVRSENNESSAVVDLLREPFRYELGRLRDTLIWGEHRYTVAARKVGTARDLLAEARARCGTVGQPLLVRVGRHVARLSGPLVWWLTRTLARDELLLGVLETGDEVQVPSVSGAVITLAPLWVVTDRRALRVALTRLGDEWSDELPPGAPFVENSGDVVALRSGTTTWRSTRANKHLFLELSSVLSHEPAARRLKIARLNWVFRGSEIEPVSFARYVIERSARTGDALAAIASYLVAAELGEARAARADLSACPSELRRNDAPADTVARLWDQWGFGRAAGYELVRSLRELGTASEPWASELHLRLYARRSPSNSEQRAFAEDLDLAEHLNAAGRLVEARALVHPRREQSRSVPEQLADSGPSPLWELSIRANELARDLAEDEGPRIAACAELARLDPLSRERLEALVSVARGTLHERASATLELLLPGGLSRSRDDAGASTRALSKEDLQTRLPHPLTRTQSALLGQLQALVAVVPEPDLAVIREFVEQVSEARHPEVALALATAARAFGFSTVPSYVSRGSKSLGLRCYGTQSPFVLIGVRHLEPGDEYALSPRELRFAFASELSHVALGHARVTADEVWAGALSRTRQGLELLGTVLPALKGVSVADRVQRYVQRVPPHLAKQVLDAAGELAAKQKLERAERETLVLSRFNEELVTAHRIMQLTADRAGLLLADDLASALRAILLLRPDYRNLLERATGEGLLPALLKPGDKEQGPEHRDLVRRVRALISFYLSPDYGLLHSLLYANSGGDVR